MQCIIVECTPSVQYDHSRYLCVPSVLSLRSEWRQHTPDVTLTDHTGSEDNAIPSGQRNDNNNTLGCA